MVHDGQLTVTVVDGQPEVTATRIDSIRRPPPIATIADAARAAAITPRPDAARSRWEGDHIDWACFDAAYLNRPEARPLLN
jgi:hypothetical protein